MIIDKDKNQIAAYFSLQNDKVAYDPQSKGIWNRINRHIHNNNKRRRSYPSVKVGRLAVGEEYAHSGLGSDLLSLVKKQYAMGNRAGCRFLTVDAYRDATKFYEKNGFDYFTTLDVLDSTRLMYFDLKDIKERVIGRLCPPSLCILRSYLSAGYACCVPGFWVLSQPSLVVHFSRIIAQGIYWRVARFRSLLAPSVASCILSIILHVMQVFNVDFFYYVRFVFGQGSRSR